MTDDKCYLVEMWEQDGYGNTGEVFLTREKAEERLKKLYEEIDDEYHQLTMEEMAAIRGRSTQKELRDWNRTRKMLCIDQKKGWEVAEYELR